MNQTGNKLQVVIEGKNFDWDHQYISGNEIKALAGIDHNTSLFLSIAPPWEDEEIRNEDKVDLARPGIEHFYVPQKLEFTINGAKFESPSQYISGKKVRSLGSIPEGDTIFLKIQRPYKDEVINDETLVDLARPGIEHFQSMATHAAVTIIINGTPHNWEKEKISFKELIMLAFGQYIELETMVYTVAYEDGPRQNVEGSMHKGQEVFVTDKMIFHATATDKS